MANKKCYGWWTLAMVLFFGMMVIGCETEETGPKYYMEIYNISSSTFDTLMSDYGTGNINGYTGTDAFNFARSQHGTNRRGTHNDQSLESIQQILESFDVGSHLVNNAITSLQQDRAYYIWLRNYEHTVTVFFYMRPK